MISNIVGLLTVALLASGLQLLPPTSSPLNISSVGEFQLHLSARIVYIDSAFASRSDPRGLTLIPPTAYEFAETFRNDLTQLTGADWTLTIIDAAPNNGSGIFIGAFGGNATELTYENGTPTEEGYELIISGSSVFIGGTGARGTWWGTRTLLQQILLRNGTLGTGRIVDTPAYATRGFMLDAGRKWYSASFLKELCTYASFYKMSEFHYHLSDNYPLSRGHNETWYEVYSQFSLMPDDGTLKGIVQRPNETLSRTDFEDVQLHCAQRGVTVIPEIEAPGHCLYLVKWKPELALDTKDLLNLSHPDAIPTVKSIWAEFLPWFQTKEVHIGADEYDSSLADDYINFVNEMSSFINETSGKRIRIWGTDEPSENVSISKDVVVQHWQYGQSDPVELQDFGYQLINSEDWWAYMSLKNNHVPISPAPYPQFFNESRVLEFADVQRWQWTPSDFNPVNTTLQLPSEASGNKGAILAAWNDNGPDATTQLEAYYAMRRGIPLVASRAWTGSRGPNVTTDTLDATIDFFSPIVPGQNLDRVPPSTNLNTSEPLISWSRQPMDNDTVTLGYGSKGMNYTLSVSATGPFTLSGPDNTLSLDTNGSLIFTSDGWPYPLRSVSEHDALNLDPSQPGRIWVNVSTSSHQSVSVVTPANISISTDVLHGSTVWVNGDFAGRFEVFVFGGKNTQFSWSQMAFVAPLQTVSSGLKSLSLARQARTVDGGASNNTAPTEYSSGGATMVSRLARKLLVIACLISMGCFYL